ncbi:hypothetical protein [Aliidiomarina soli]|uniref:DUF3304 domain-containing protein n=1 Tax=Aliidiomarina soli TaxID=1928574 RepID=A0A432WEA7_9GAMM|nr:hypothetical protein [Aliidiomarina soli]RUO31160.1 hypothetical protein CWE14_11740 [Aliidiomarina soli]
MKRFSLIIALLLFASGCSSLSYDIAHQNISDQMICVEKGIWTRDTWGGGCIGAFTEEMLFPVQRVNGDRRESLPDSIGVVWTNAEEDVLEEHIPLNKESLPKLRRGESYKFVVSLTQERIQQLEVIVIPTGNVRQKKRKSMLYCANGEGMCEFLTPFTTDSYYDPDTLTVPQKEKLERQREVGKKLREG